MAEVNLGSKHLRGNLERGVLTITLDRPERRNACTMEMYQGIKRAALLVENDPAIDVLVITGTVTPFARAATWRENLQRVGAGTAKRTGISFPLSSSSAAPRLSSAR